MTAALDDAVPPPVDPIPLSIRPPKGYWMRDAAHARTPRTRFSEVVGEAATRHNRRWFAEIGTLFETMEYTKIGGWDYIRLVPLGGKEPPALPAWLAGLALRVVPAVRRRCANAVAAVRSDLAGELLGRWESEWRPDFIGRAAQLRDVEPADLDDAQLEEHLGHVTGLLDDGLAVHFRLISPISLGLAELAFTSRDLLGWDHVQSFRLLVGTSEMSTAPARALAGLAATAAAHPDVRRLVGDDAPLAEVLDADRAFAAEFARYLREYGCRALGYELADPCLDEQPELVLALVRDQLVTGYDPDTAAAANRAQRAAVRTEAERLLATRPEADRRRFERVLERALWAYPVREDNEFHTFSVPAALVRRAVLRFGDRLTDRGLLDRPQDAFHLAPDELRAALRDGADRRVVTRTRAAERAWALAHPGPPSYGPPPSRQPSLRWLPAQARLVLECTLWTFHQVFGGDPTSVPTGDPNLVPTVDPVSEPGRPPAPRPSVDGIAASPGSYTGPARIIRGEHDFDRLQAGDVLVCPATSPVWSLLFPSIGALVTDDGGMLSHQAIIAREYGIPAVVGTGIATRRLTDGQLITVDGTSGTVRALS